MPDFQLPMTLNPHNLGHPGIQTEFWSPNFGLHPTLLPPTTSLLHQNILPAYKIPNFHAILSQYMGLNSLGIFGGGAVGGGGGNSGGYPQNLTINTTPRLSPHSCSPKDQISPTSSIHNEK